MRNYSFRLADDDDGSSCGFISIDSDTDFFDALGDEDQVQNYGDVTDFRFNTEVEIFPLGKGKSTFVLMNHDGSYYYDARQDDDYYNEHLMDEPIDDGDTDQCELQDTKQEMPTNPEVPASAISDGLGNMVIMGAIEKGFQRVFGGANEDEHVPVGREAASGDSRHAAASTEAMAAKYVLYRL